MTLATSHFTKRGYSQTLLLEITKKKMLLMSTNNMLQEIQFLLFIENKD